MVDNLVKEPGAEFVFGLITKVMAPTKILYLLNADKPQPQIRIWSHLQIQMISTPSKNFKFIFFLNFKSRSKYTMYA